MNDIRGPENVNPDGTCGGRFYVGTARQVGATTALVNTYTHRVTLTRRSGSGAYAYGYSAVEAHREARRQLRHGFGNTDHETCLIQRYREGRWI